MIQHIIECTCKAYGISEIELKSKSRKRIIVYARYAAAVLIYKYAQPVSLTRVGRLLNIDHSTVIHGIKKVQDLSYYSDFEEPFRKVEGEIVERYMKGPVRFTDKVIFHLTHHKGRKINPTHVPLIEDVSEAVRLLLKKENQPQPQPSKIRSLEPIV